MKRFGYFLAVGVLWAVIHLPVSAELTSFDFLNIPATASRAAYGFAPAAQSGSLEGLWGNPASIAGLSNSFSALLAGNTHLEINLLSGGISYGNGSFHFGAGVSLLLPGEIAGALDLTSLNQSIAGGDILFLGSAALQLGRILKLPFFWDVGLNANLVSETLGPNRLGALFFDAGTICGLNFGAVWSASLGLDIRHFGLQTEGKSQPLPMAVSLGGTLRFQPAHYLGIELLAQGDFLGKEEKTFSLGSSLELFHFLLLRGGFSLGEKGPGFTAGAGVKMNFANRTSVSIESAFFPTQTSESEVVFQTTASFSRKEAAYLEKPSPLFPPNPRLGILIGDSFFVGLREKIVSVCKSKFPKYTCNEETVLTPQSEAAWVHLEGKLYAELARKMKFSKILVVLRSLDVSGEGRGVVFVFNVATGSFEQREEFLLPTEGEESVALALEKISNVKI